MDGTVDGISQTVPVAPAAEPLPPAPSPEAPVPENPPVAEDSGKTLDLYV
jgi:hypothetical protein